MYNNSMTYSNTFHLVSSSPYPLLCSNSLSLLMIGILLSLNCYITLSLQIGIVLLLVHIVLWVYDMITEATYFGSHTLQVEAGLSIGLILFIASEAILFTSVFWALFHSSLSPSTSIGCQYPPKGINAVSPWSIPLLNSILLLSSSISITAAHYAIIARIRQYTIHYLIITVTKALYFITLQYVEYYTSTFTITDSIYGSVFYALTGLHGLHVLAGLLLILVALARIFYYHNTDYHHYGLILAVAYWHFIDILWLFVYTSIYLKI